MGETGAFSVARAIVGRHRVEWEHSAGAPGPSSQGSEEASWGMRHPSRDPKDGLGLARPEVEPKREIESAPHRGRDMR